MRPGFQGHGLGLALAGQDLDHTCRATQQEMLALQVPVPTPLLSHMKMPRAVGQHRMSFSVPDFPRPLQYLVRLASPLGSFCRVISGHSLSSYRDPYTRDYSNKLPFIAGYDWIPTGILDPSPSATMLRVLRGWHAGFRSLPWPAFPRTQELDPKACLLQLLSICLPAWPSACLSS